MNLKNIFIASFLLFIPFLTISASTFPEEDAGISAYVKLDDINSEILNETQAFIEKEGSSIESSETHIIGKIPIEIISEDNSHLFDIYVNIYLDLDGWLVAYFPEDTPSSKMVQWNNYSPGNMDPSILEKAIDKVSDEINVGYSGSPDYYHFEYENANRMTIIIDTVETIGLKNSPDIGNSVDYWNKNNFSVTIPGIVHETSYSVYFSDNIGRVCGYRLSVNDNLVKYDADYICGSGGEFFYDFYPLNTFPVNTSCSVVFKAESYANSLRMGAATVLIYEVGVE
jgi:hypothetical protein